MTPKDYEQMGKMIKNAMPEGHPSAEARSLLLHQEALFAGLLWLFDPDRARATGRSYLFARVCLELAKRGYTVNLEDVTQTVAGQSGHHIRRHFANQVLSIAQRDYPQDMFEYRMTQNTLTYKGRRPK